MGGAFVKKINDLDEEAFQALYGRWDPLEPAQVAELFRAPSVRWWIAGGRAARAGAPDRHHEDIDVAVRIDDLDGLRKDLSDWHLWEANSGTLRPLLPGDHLTEGCEELWARRNAQHPWQLDLVLDRSGEDEWVFKRDARIRVPWARALYTVNGIQYLRPEIALLHKAHLDRPKDKADLAAARLDPDARDWLAENVGPAWLSHLGGPCADQRGPHTKRDIVSSGRRGRRARYVPDQRSHRGQSRSLTDNDTLDPQVSQSAGDGAAAP